MQSEGNKNLVSPELWQDRIQQQLSSELSQKEWCSQNNISVSTFRYWKRRLGLSTGSQTDIQKDIVFAKLPTEEELTGHVPGSCPVRIHTSYGVHIQLEPACSRELLRDLLWALKINA